MAGWLAGWLKLYSSRNRILSNYGQIYQANTEADQKQIETFGSRKKFSAFQSASSRLATPRTESALRLNLISTGRPHQEVLNTVAALHQSLEIPR